MTERKIVSIPIGKLIAHEQNPNRMGKAVFAKLIAHIERTGNYEPIIVREHPKQTGDYQMLNGHHRKLALEQLGYAQADCIVWQVDNDEAMILLATLNRLGGTDDITKKHELVKRLSDRYGSDELAGMLNETQASIEKLRYLSSSVRLPEAVAQQAMLEPMVFYVDEQQQRTILETIECEAAELEGTRAQRRSAALARICERHCMERADG